MSLLVLVMVFFENNVRVVEEWYWRGNLKGVFEVFYVLIFVFLNIFINYCKIL